MTPLETIAARVQEQFGIDPATLGPSTVRIAVQTRMRARGTKSVDEYEAVLAASDAELADLVEEIVVPETWFFRDRQPFLALAQWVATDWLPTHPTGVLRVLSVPCASGEEPYSIVMALLDAGVSPDRFVVEGVDVSQRALAKVRGGVYGRNSFRGADQTFRDRYFTVTAGNCVLTDDVRRQVHFRQGNLLDPLFAAGESLYDVIFCRNLLIYFDTAAQRRAIAALGNLLAPAGLLFVGHAETVLLSSAGFAAVDMPLAFAFERRRAEAPPRPGDAGANRRPAANRRSASTPSRPVRRTPPTVPVHGPVGTPVPKPVRPKEKTAAPEPAATIAEAQQLADAGRLDAAVDVCRRYLRAHGPDAAAYYLIGLARDAAGAPSEASENYRKALYLSPDHYEALVHLALVVEKAGDPAGARMLQERVRRLSGRMLHRKAVA